MAQEGNNDCIQKLMDQEKSNEKQLQGMNKIEELVKVTKLIEKPKVLKDTVKKSKGKYTLRADTRKRRTKFNTKQSTSNQAMIPRIPRKVLRIIYLLHHKRFLKFVSKFFNPSPKNHSTLFLDKLTISSTKHINVKINSINNKNKNK